MTPQESYNLAQAQAAKARAEIMHRMRVEGQTLAQIGRLHGISRERVRQMLAKYFPR